MVVEIIYNKNTNRVIAAQEIDRETHDWILQTDQEFIKLAGSLPQDDITRYKLNDALNELEVDPTYKTSIEILAAIKAAKLNKIDSASTLNEFKVILTEMVTDQYREVL